MATMNWSGFASRVSLVLLLMSVGMNALQAKRIRDLVEPRAVASRVGQTATPIPGWTPQGQPKTLTFEPGRATVLYFFSPTCRWCEQNWQNVRALAQASRDRFRFVALASEKDLAGFLVARQLEFEVVGGISDDVKRAFGLAGTPHTVVVSSQGRISHEWNGAFTGRRQRQVEAFFEITLPGLAGPPEVR